MSDDSLELALIHEVFHDRGGTARLVERLRDARSRGAELAVLPELPLNRWCPATRNARDDDAEPAAGPRYRALAEAARTAEIGLLGGAIVRDEASGRRVNRALLFDRRGAPVAGYDKLHLPCEDGFWETDHYGAGDEPPAAVDGFGLPLGIQLCSDLNRPQGSLLLAADGAELILGPRATDPSHYERWRVVIRANAITCAAYVVSVNRPAPENGVPFGGPSLAVAPDGEVLLETTEPLSVVRLERAAVARARSEYPGYLPLRADLWARGWSAIGPDTP